MNKNSLGLAKEVFFNAGVRQARRLKAKTSKTIFERGRTMTHLQIIHGRLQEAAYKLTDNFCYGCYKVVKGERCPDCGTDDFMRHLSGVGVEYGTEWVIGHLFQTRLTPVDGEELYEELLDECYPEVKVGEIVYSPSQVIKNMDPLYFQMGTGENLQHLAEDGVLYEYGGDYYHMHDLDKMLDEIEHQ